MRIAVSGASGFIGHYVLKTLHARGFDVVALTRSLAGRQALPGVSRWLEMDIRHAPSDSFAAMGEPDVLIHLAWDGLPNYQSNHHVDVELPAQLAFLAKSIEGGLKRLVVTGTCYEYGLAAGELTEIASTHPCTQYGLAKDLLRRELFDLREQYDFDLVWLRLFYLYGDGQSERSLYSMLCTAIAQGAETFDMSGGEQLRDFLPVDEAARLIVEIAERENANGVFNVCSGRPVAVRDLVEGWITDRGAKVRVNLGRIPYSPDESMTFWGSRKKLDAIVGSKSTPKGGDRHQDAILTIPSTNQR